MAGSVKKPPKAFGYVTRGLNIMRPAALVAFLGALVPFALYAHIHLLGREDDYTGALAIFLRVFDLLLAGALLCLTFGVGRAICKKLTLTFPNLAEEWSFSVAIGVGVLGLSLLALGLIGLLRPIPVLALLLILMAVSARQLRDLYRGVAYKCRRAAPDRTTSIIALLFALFIVLLVLRAATPPHSYDEAIYHLSVARRFATSGRVYPVIDNWAGNMPFLVQMVYASCLLFGSDIAAKLFSLGLALTCSI
jgi:hypothetical protein